MKKTLEWIKSATPYVTTIAFFAYSILTLLDPRSPYLPNLTSEGLVLSGVNILMLTMAFSLWEERKDRKEERRQFLKHSDKIESMIRQQERVLISKGTIQTWDDSLHVIQRSEHRIQAITWGGPKAPPEWIAKLHEHMKERSKLGQPISYDVVMYVEPGFLENDGLKKQNDDRAETFKKEGLDIRIWVIETPSPMVIDVMIIDGKHVSIALISNSFDSRSLALSIMNNPDAGMAFSGWFDRLVRIGTKVI